MATKNDLHDHRLHAELIGSSASAACVGLSPWATPLQEYLRRVAIFDGRAPTSAQSIDPERSYFGLALEPVIRGAFSRETGLLVRANRRVFRSREHKHLIATPDSFIVGARSILELKTAGLRTSRAWGDEGTDKVPLHYRVQVAHQMLVCDYDRAQLAVLFGGHDLRIYRIERDADFERMLLERLAEFWRRLQERDPPPPTTLADAALLWPADDGTGVVASRQVSGQLDELKRIRREVKNLQEIADRHELELKTYMGEASRLVGEDGAELASWKAQTARRLDQARLKAEEPAVYERCLKTSETRVLRIKQEQRPWD